MSIRNTLMGTTALLALATGAEGQSIDYGSLEMMFGEPVTEGATGTPKRASETPVNMTIITADEISRSGARDVPEILRRAAGVDVQRLGQRGALVSIRGRNHDGQRLRVLVNGRDTFRPYEGNTVWEALPVSVEEIRQIEIVRGPSTALYGANAVTGVINIITFSPLHDKVNTVSASIGDNGHREVSGVSTLKLGDAGGIRLSGGYMEIDRADALLTSAQQLVRPDTPDSYRFSGDALFNLTDKLIMGAEVTYFKGDYLSQNWLGTGEAGNSEDHSFKVSMALDSDFGRWTMQAFQNKNSENRKAVFNSDDGIAVVDQNIEAKTNYIDLSNAQSLGSTNIRATVGYRQDVVEQFGGSPLDGTGDVGYRTLFFSGLVDHTFSDKLSLAVSARYDRLDSYRTTAEAPFQPFTNDDFGTRNEFSANIGLTYKLSEQDTVKLMYAHGFEAPNLFAIGGQLAATPLRYFGGRPNVDTAIYNQYEIQYLRPLTGVNGSLSASVFYRTDSKLITRTGTGAVLPSADDSVPYVTTANIGSADTLGFELDVKGRTENNIIWGLQYSFADTSDDLDSGGLPLTADVYGWVREYFSDRSSKHIVTGNLGYTNDRFSVDALVQYKSGFTSYVGPVIIPGVVDPFRDISGVWIGNLTASYKITDKLTLSLIGEGLLDNLREESVDPALAAERRIRASLSFSF